MNAPTLPAPLARRAQRAARIWRSVRRFAADYWPGRRTALLTGGMVLLFLFAGASAAGADDGSGEQGGVLAPLNVISSEGVPLDNYDLKSEDGGTTDIRSHVCNLLLGSGFALVRILVGLMCWACQWVFNFPVVKTLVETAQKLNAAFFQAAANDLALYALFLAAGVAFGCVLIMRGKVGRGAGEMLITLLLSTLVLLPALTPRSVLGEQGPLMQSQAAAHEVSQMAAGVNGPDPGCLSDQDKNDPSCPMRMVLTRTLVVQPYELLQYGFIPDPNSSNANVRAIAETHRKWIHGEFKGKKAGSCGDGWTDWMPGDDALCPATSGWEDMKADLKTHGPEGQAAYDFAVNSNWDRVGGTLLVLVAVLIVAIVVLGMCLVHVGTQFADVTAASLTAPAMVWAMLPGGNRSVLWKWLGIFLTSVVTEFAVSIMLPLFALGANQIMTDNQNTVVIQRLLILDGFALVLLVLHRRLFSAAGQVGERFANRMRYAKIGGSLWLGENSGMALAMSQAMGTLSNSAGAGAIGAGRAGLGLLAGGGLFGGGSAVHGALMRKARIAEGLAAIADPGLGRMNAGAMAMGAYGEVRRGMAALALPFHAAHQLVAGNPLPAHKLARRLKPVGSRGPLGGIHPPGGPSGPGGHGPGGAGPAGGGPAGGGRPPFGRQQQMPAHGLTPAGHALHNTLLNTRAGRLAIRAGQVGKLGFNATLGAPATLTRINRAGAAAWQNVSHQWDHYSNVRKAWWDDEKQGAVLTGHAVRSGYRAAQSGYNAVQAGYNHVYHHAATFGDVHGAHLAAAPLIAASHFLYGADPAAVSEAFAARPSYSATTTAWDPVDRASDSTLVPDGDAGSVISRDGDRPGTVSVTFSGHDDGAAGYGGEGGIVDHAGSLVRGETPSTSAGEVARPEPVDWGASDHGPSDIRSALGPGVVPPSRPAIVVNDEPGMVVDPDTGEILASGLTWPSASSPEAPAVEGLDLDVLRRVGPEVLRSPDGTSIEALRMRRHLGHAPGGDGAVRPGPSADGAGDES
ncbi:hypothetical protein ACFW1A_23810 [Kitasatospora sp. NPDC058965]|uniref:hypothetical protein n=1 Tax=Kitasatospora sp. NPDC058965 TaxID=3346682 RepID=UPI003686DFF9